MTSTRRTRQYRVTHIPTGIVTVVNAVAYFDSDAESKAYHQYAATEAGLRYGLDASVSLVPKGQGIPLAFDSIPLVLRPRVA